MEEQEGFEEVNNRWNCRKKQQQVIIETSRNSEIKAEKKKASIYLSRMTKETTIEGIRSFLNRKGIKEEVVVEDLKTMGPYKALKLGFPFEHLLLMENLEFWPQGARIRAFRISYRTWRQNRWARVDMQRHFHRSRGNKIKIEGIETQRDKRGKTHIT
jgi:hypothetical protein